MAPLYWADKVGDDGLGMGAPSSVDFARLRLATRAGYPYEGVRSQPAQTGAFSTGLDTGSTGLRWRGRRQRARNANAAFATTRTRMGLDDEAPRPMQMLQLGSTPMTEIRLSSGQIDLLKAMVEAWDCRDQDGNRQKFMFYTALGTGTQIQHLGLSDEVLGVDLTDLEEFADHGLITIDYSGKARGTFRLRSEARDVLGQIARREQIESQSAVGQGAGTDLWGRLMLEVLAKHGPRISRETIFEAFPYEQVQRAHIDEWLENALGDGLVIREEGPGSVALWSITATGEAELS